MTATVTQMGKIVTVAEKALYGDPQFTCIDTGTAAVLAAVVTPDTQSGNRTAKSVRMFHLTLSYSAAPAVSTLTVKDDTTVIWQCEIAATSPTVLTFDFSKKPLRSTPGKALTAGVGSAGGSVVQTISWTGDYVSAA